VWVATGTRGKVGRLGRCGNNGHHEGTWLAAPRPAPIPLGADGCAVGRAVGRADGGTVWRLTGVGLVGIRGEMTRLEGFPVAPDAPDAPVAVDVIGVVRVTAAGE
jgi:hypothetical protein